MTTTKPAQRLRERIAADPAFFADRVLGAKFWSRQVELAQAIRDHRLVAVRSGHAVGKTFALAAIAIEFLISRRNRRLLLTGPTHDNTKNGIWADMREHFDRATTRGFPLGGVMGRESWELSPKWNARIASVTNPSALQGARGVETMAIIDEAQGFDDPDMFAAIHSLTQAEGSRLVVSGNPIRGRGMFFDLATRPGVHTMRISCLDHPNIVQREEVIPGAVTQTWIDEIPKDSQAYRSRVLGEFPTAGSDQLITLESLDAVADIKPPVDVEPSMGVDVARKGADHCCVVVMDRNRIVRHVERWQPNHDGLLLMSVAGRVQRIAAERNIPAHRVGVDVIGMGSGVVDRCAEAGFPVVGVDFSERPSGQWNATTGSVKLKNRRAELHWAMRCLIQQGLIGIPARFGDLRADLMLPAFDFDGSGAIVIQSKDEIRAIAGRSPDVGDAAILALGVGCGPRLLAF